MLCWDPCLKIVTWGHIVPLTGFLLVFVVFGERLEYLVPEPKSPLTSTLS